MTEPLHIDTHTARLTRTIAGPPRQGYGSCGYYFQLPLNYRQPTGGENIKVFAREVYSLQGAIPREERPWLLYLQGGPGFESPRPDCSGWLAEALKTFRVLLLDQRGTGLSSPITGRVLQGVGDAAAQAEYLGLFRADHIVADAEAIRRILQIPRWYTLGQSFGGFCTLSYLSFFPEALAGCLITGGLPGVHATAEQVYQHSYTAIAARWAEYLSWYPQDQEVLNRVRDKVAAGTTRLPGGEVLTVPRLQMLGMYLGGNTRVDQLHFLLERAVEPSGELSDFFLTSVEQQLSFRVNPLYALLHESIYAHQACPGSAPTRWAAQRVKDQRSEFSPEAQDLLLTGEHILPCFFTADPALAPFQQAAQLLAERTDWPALYDVPALETNKVPVAAAVYRDDIFVPVELSLATADTMAHTQVWLTGEYHHDGLRADGAKIFSTLAAMAGFPTRG